MHDIDSLSLSDQITFGTQQYLSQRESDYEEVINTKKRCICLSDGVARGAVVYKVEDALDAGLVDHVQF